MVERLKIEWAESIGSTPCTTRGLQEMFCQVTESTLLWTTFKEKVSLILWKGKKMTVSWSKS